MVGDCIIAQPAAGGGTRHDVVAADWRALRCAATGQVYAAHRIIIDQTISAKLQAAKTRCLTVGLIGIACRYAKRFSCHGQCAVSETDRVVASSQPGHLDWVSTHRTG